MNSKIFLLAALAVLVSCSDGKESQALLTTQYGSPKALLAHLEQDKMTWWTYHKNEIMLSSEFTPLNSEGNRIKKEEFLKQLASGDFMAIKVTDREKKEYLKLYRLGDAADTGIAEMMKSDLMIAFDFYSREGLSFPEFNFTDLDGKVFSSDNLKGKTLILKTWFIGCAPCIAEMPELNEMVKHYKERDDVVFVSLALDKEDALRKFLVKTQFDYPVVARQKKFIFEKLQSEAFPTHFIVGKDGKIVKVVNRVEELKLAMKEHGI